MAHPALYAADGRRKYLNAAKRGRFLAATGTASAEARTFCLALAYLGCRISEAMALTAGDVQPAAGLVVIRTLKHRDQLVVREVSAAPDLIKALQAGHDLGRPAALLWPWGRTTAWATVKMVMDAAEVRGLPASPKGLRHGFGVHAVMSGVPLYLIQKWLDHATSRTRPSTQTCSAPRNARSPDACGAD